jgi:Flp pilus assembly protein TadD
VRTALASLLLAAAALASPTVPELVAEGRKLCEAGRYDEAEARFSEVALAEPANWRGHFWLSVCALQKSIREEDPRVRGEFLATAEAHAWRLCKEPGMFLTHPMPKYLLGIAASLRGDRVVAYEALDSAVRARLDLFRACEEVSLRTSVERAYARSAIDMGKQMLLVGNIDKAHFYLVQGSTYLPKEDGEAQADLDRHLAAAQEALSRFDEAVASLRRAIGYAKDDPDTRYELLASIAMIHLRNEKLEEGLKVLGEMPADCAHVDVLAARCFALRVEALREPEGEPMARALAGYLDAMGKVAKDERYRFVVAYGELLLGRIGAVAKESDKPELEAEIARLLEEAKIRPECPPIYWLLKQIYRLLGDGEKELYYQRLHEEKRKEIENKERYDQHGRPRC